MELHEQLHSPSAFTPPLNRRETSSSGAPVLAEAFNGIKDVVDAPGSSPVASSNRSKTTLFTIDNIIGKP